jgi:Mn2+/Fe2+ NRAMP family transporter
LAAFELPPEVYAVLLLLCVANIFNLGADIAAMGAAAQLLWGGNLNVYAVALGLVSLFLQIYLPYRRYVQYLKWLTTVLFPYVATAFVVHVPWKGALRGTVIPDISWNADYWMALVAVLGTTISPYLFFWQTSGEAEEVKVTPGELPLKRKPWQALNQFRRM